MKKIMFILMIVGGINQVNGQDWLIGLNKGCTKSNGSRDWGKLSLNNDKPIMDKILNCINIDELRKKNPKFRTAFINTNCSSNKKLSGDDLEQERKNLCKKCLETDIVELFDEIDKDLYEDNNEEADKITLLNKRLENYKLYSDNFNNLISELSILNTQVYKNGDFLNFLKPLKKIIKANRKQKLNALENFFIVVTCDLRLQNEIESDITSLFIDIKNDLFKSRQNVDCKIYKTHMLFGKYCYKTYNDVINNNILLLIRKIKKYVSLANTNFSDLITKLENPNNQNTSNGSDSLNVIALELKKFIDEFGWYEVKTSKLLKDLLTGLMGNPMVFPPSDLCVMPSAPPPCAPSCHNTYHVYLHKDNGITF